MKIIDQYNNRHNEDDVFMVLEGLIKLRDAIYLAIEEGNDMNLTYEEKAFFDVLSTDLEVLELMESEILMLIAKELTKSIHETMDVTGDEWYKSERAQAKMRTKIKRLLKKYDYPPNKSDKAIEQVLEQVPLQCMNLK